MKPLERLKAKFEGQLTDRPLFCPAIYEHKAALIDKSPSQIAQDADLLTEAVLAEYETYKPDMLTVGVDIYNIEAEAIGCKVLYPEAIDAVPVVVDRVLHTAADVDRLPHIDAEQTARMPLMLKAAENVHKKLGDHVLVRGAVSGPFSMAAELMGIEPLLIAMMMKPELFQKLLDYCTAIVIDYGKAFIKRGLSVCIFDSQATPPLLSPNLYQTFILPSIVRINAAFKQSGCVYTEYVIGGKTDAIAVFMLASECDIILSDYPSYPTSFIQTKSRQQLIRRNISSMLIEKGDTPELRQQIHYIKTLINTYSNFIIGTGVISYNTSVEYLCKVMKTVQEVSYD